MGSLIEFNNTLQITGSQGFPSKLLDIKKHQRNPESVKKLVGRVFKFRNKLGARIFHLPPVRVFLVQNIRGKWLHWGTAQIIEQTITVKKGGPVTSGKFKIFQIYGPEFQKQMTIHDSPKGKSYF